VCPCPSWSRTGQLWKSQVLCPLSYFFSSSLHAWLQVWVGHESMLFMERIKVFLVWRIPRASCPGIFRLSQTLHGKNLYCPSLRRRACIIWKEKRACAASWQGEKPVFFSVERLHGFDALSSLESIVFCPAHVSWVAALLWKISCKSCMIQCCCLENKNVSWL
jgi:hypothetical protein